MASLLPFLLLSLILQSISVVAQTKSTIATGDSFTAQTNNSTWLLSPSGDFAFGFLPIKDTDLFLLSIWYAKISEKTIVWYANGDSPAPKGSKVELNVNDGLVLTSPNGDGLWNTTALIRGGVFRGVFNDTGNFVLQDGDFSSQWETFKFPSDTLLPSQVVEKGGKLSSRLKETNFSKGRCVEEMEQEDEEKAILTDWAYDCYNEGAVDALVEGDNEALDDKEKLEKLVMIAIWCVQEDPYLRPTMRKVLHMLEGTVDVQVPPYPSPISIQYSLN
ncbi:hypothetical protein TSUD_354480 [Trifolium subterraneum]|uniref:Bulb-type lectin domain-containing protein n=1 Tax=Trifolium subterraneum TaxID=3900 RepID=A0A2Z6NKX5_TRISU|nr:hypothetical protein TSUD_354480 [Trifolium subterraneum]